MRVLVLEGCLNYAADLAFIAPLKRLADVVEYAEPSKSEEEISRAWREPTS